MNVASQLVVLSELFFMPFLNENLQQGDQIICKLGENDKMIWMSQLSYLCTTVSVHWFSIFTLTSLSVYLLMTGVNWVCQSFIVKSVIFIDNSTFRKWSAKLSIEITIKCCYKSFRSSVVKSCKMLSLQSPLFLPFFKGKRFNRKSG